MKREIAETFFINLAQLFAMGMFVGIRGATLLDLVSAYAADVKSISYLFLIFSIGAGFGGPAGGFVIDRFPVTPFLVLFAGQMTHALVQCLYPRMGSMWAFFALCFIHGAANGALEA